MGGLLRPLARIRFEREFRRHVYSRMLGLEVVGIVIEQGQKNLAELERKGKKKSDNKARIQISFRQGVTFSDWKQKFGRKEKKRGTMEQVEVAFPFLHTSSEKKQDLRSPFPEILLSFSGNWFVPNFAPSSPPSFSAALPRGL